MCDIMGYSFAGLFILSFDQLYNCSGGFMAKGRANRFVFGESDFRLNTFDRISFLVFTILANEPAVPVAAHNNATSKPSTTDTQRGCAPHYRIRTNCTFALSPHNRNIRYHRLHRMHRMHLIGSHKELL